LSSNGKAWRDYAPVKRWVKLSRVVRWTILGFIALLIVVRLALPSMVKAYVNRQLNKTPEYSGSVGDIDIDLWRGAYVIRELRMLKTGGDVPVPFFYAPRTDLSMEWKELFHGSVVGEIYLDRPELNFVAGPTDEETQTGENKDWRKTVESLFPFRLNRFEVAHGEIHFRNFHSRPPVDISIHDLQSIATNLTNSRDINQPLPAGVVARGRTVGEGEFSVLLHLDAFAPAPTYKLEASITNMNLTALNDFLKAYGKFDVERGTAAIFIEVAAADGRYEGYVKPLLENIDVFSWQKEKRKNILQIFWQAIVGTAATVLKNQPKDRLATTIPISGEYDNSKADILPAIGGVLKNAFVRALVPKLDHTVSFEEVDTKQKRQREEKAKP
jgi:hypothetical protein